MVVVLAEDQRSQNLARRYLERLGYGSRAIRLLPLPSGGAGDQFALESYPEQVEAVRKRSAGTALIVHIDADGYSVHEREKQLAERSARDRATVVQWIPKRNIETWDARPE